MGTEAGEPDVESELSASLDEANAAAVAGAGTLADPEASSDQDTPKEPDAPSSFVGPRGCAGQCALLIRLGGSDYAGRHLFGCGSRNTCSTRRCGSSWGHILRVPLIIRADDQACRRDNRL